MPILLVLFAFIQTAPAQLLTKESIKGKWTVTAAIKKEELLPLDSDAALIQYWFDKELAEKRQEQGPNATLDRIDSINISGASVIFLLMRQLKIEFKGNGKFRLTGPPVLRKRVDINGNWQLDEATQTIHITEKPKQADEAPRTMKATLRGQQLFLQEEDHPTEGWLFRKKR